MATMVKFVRDHMTAVIAGILVTLVTALALGGWTAHAFVSGLATKSEVKLEVQSLAVKSDYLMDRRLEGLVREIAELERLQKLTPVQIERLRELRLQLEEARRVQKGK